MTDCKLEYQALLEAYGPDRPPVELARKFIDRLSSLRSGWYQLKKGREGLEAALAEKKGAEEEELVRAAADKAVAFAEKETNAKEAKVAPVAPSKASKATIPPAAKKANQEGWSAKIFWSVTRFGR